MWCVVGVVCGWCGGVWLCVVGEVGVVGGGWCGGVWLCVVEMGKRGILV